MKRRRSSRRIVHRPMPTRAVRMFSGRMADSVSSLNVGRRKFRKLYSNPNVYLVGNFASENELNMIEEGAATKLLAWEANRKRRLKKTMSSGEGMSRDYSAELKYLRFGKSCSAFIRQLEERAGSLIGESSTNVEPIGLLCPQAVEFFSLHHSHGDLQNSGKDVDPRYLRRITTLYLYTRNRSNEERYHLIFPKLGLRIFPKRGDAILFCNVLEDGTPDTRVQHYCLNKSMSNTNPGQRSVDRVNLHGLAIWVTDTNLQELTMLEDKGGKKKKSLSPKKKQKKRQKRKLPS